MRSYRILLTLWFRKWAGDPRAIQELAQGLIARGHHILVACPAEGVLGERLLAAGVPVRHFEFGRGWDPRSGKRLAGLIRDESIDLVDAYGSRDRKAAILACRLFRAPARLVITRRAMSSSFPLQNRIYSMAADRVIAISHGVRETLLRGGMQADKVKVVHPGLDPRRVEGEVIPGELKALREELGLDASLPTVGVVGRRKDQETLLRALARLDFPANVLFVGIGRDDALGALEGELPEGSRVVYTGFRDPVLPFYHLLDAKVLTTRREGLSQAILEAMAIGIPVISAAVGGTPEALDGGRSGLLFPPGDDAALATQLQRLLGDAELRCTLAAAGQQRVRETFHADALVRGTEAVYQEVLESVSRTEGAA